MSSMNKRTTFLTVRLPQQTHQAFRAKAEKYGGISEVLRELAEAFIEDRLSVTPPVTPKKESLYVTRIQD
jgi:hypothetical protein